MNKKLSLLLSLMFIFNSSSVFAYSQAANSQNNEQIKGKINSIIAVNNFDKEEVIIENINHNTVPTYKGDTNDVSVRAIGSNENINIKRKKDSSFEEDVDLFKTFTNHFQEYKTSFDYDGKLRTFQFSKNKYEEDFGINRSINDEPVVEVWKWAKNHDLKSVDYDDMYIFNMNLTMEALKYYAETKEDGMKIWLKLDSYFNNPKDTKIFDNNIHKFGKTKVKFERLEDSKINVVFVKNNITYKENEVIFKDRTLKEAVKKALNKNEEIIFKNELKDIKELDLSMKVVGILSRGRGITNLEGIQYCVNLERLDLTGSRYLNDFTPIEKLTKLKTLNLKYSGIKELSALSKLKNLQSLNIENTEIKDISPLDGIANLKNLYISGEIKRGAYNEKRIEEKKKVILYVNEDRLTFNDQDVAVFHADYYDGLINKDYEVIAEPIYDYIGEFKDGVAEIRYKGQKGTIDLEGNINIPYTFSEKSHSFSEGYACTYTNGETGYILDKEGKINGKYGYSVRKFIPFRNGYCAVKVENSSSVFDEPEILILDKNLDTVLKYNFPGDDIEVDLYGGYVKAVEEKNGTEKHVLKRISDGKIVYEFKEIELEQGKEYKLWNGYSDWEEKFHMNNGIISLYDFNNVLKYKKRVYTDNGYQYKDEYNYLKGLYDVEKKEYVNDFRYSSPREFKDGLAKFWKGFNLSDSTNTAQPSDIHGFMDQNGNIVIDNKTISRKITSERGVLFTEFNEGYCVILDVNPNKPEWIYGLMDTKGNILMEPQYKFLGNYSDGVFLAVEEINGKEVVKYIDIEGNTILELGDDMYPVYYAKNYYPNEYDRLRITNNTQYVSDFHEGRAVMARAKVVDGEEKLQYGYIDKKGDWVLEPKYKETRNYSEGYSFVVEDEDCAYYLDKNFKRLGYYKKAVKNKRKLEPVSESKWNKLKSQNKLKGDLEKE